MSFVFAGFIGGLVAVFCVQNVAPKEVISYEENRSPRAVLAADNFSTAPYNFIEAAELATPAVVHIEAKESEALAQQRFQNQKRRSPFDGFFNFGDMDDFFW